MSTVEITGIRIFPFDTRGSGGKTLAMAEVELAGAVRIRGLRIVESRGGGLFVTLPSRRTRDGRYQDLVELTDKGFARELRAKVLEAFREHSEELG